MDNTRIVFIIGFPRSGTQLLRELLNNHPDVSLGHEGNFIPRLVSRIGQNADLSDVSLWPTIFREFKATAFYAGKAKSGKALSKVAFINALEDRSRESKLVRWADVFEVIFRAYATHPEAPILGDKSHGYLRHLSLIRNIFDNVRFIFIVRDPRDQALSALETWGRHPLRSAQGWATMAAKAETYGLDRAPDTLTVRYEDLTTDTNKELERICAHLQISKTPGMAVLNRSVEAKSHRPKLEGVVKQSAKYRQAFSTNMIQELSEITLPYLTKYGYPTENVTKPRTLSKARLQYLKYQDGFATLRYHMWEKGILTGFNYYRKRHFEGRIGR